MRNLAFIGIAGMAFTGHWAFRDDALFTLFALCAAPLVIVTFVRTFRHGDRND